MEKLLRKVRNSTLVRMVKSVDVSARGDYIVKKITPKEIRRLYYLMSCTALLRGSDYLFAGSMAVPSPTLALTESILQLPYWGWGYILAALVLILSVRFKMIFFGALGHGSLAVLYFVTAIITLQTTLPVLDNYRGAGPLLIMCYLHYRGVILLGFPFKKNVHGGIVYPKSGD